jgi:hypothetical protein
MNVKEELALAEVPSGPKSGTLAGSHVADLTGLSKMVVLCEFCNPKFNPRKNHYEVWRHETYVRGGCDGCGQYTLHGRAFIHQATHDLVGEWENRPLSSRRGRWSLRS